MRKVILLIILIFITISCENDNKFISLFLITNEINVGQNRIVLSIIDSEGTSLRENIELKNCERIWAIGSIHGNLIGIKNIHKHILSYFNINDKIIYLRIYNYVISANE